VNVATAEAMQAPPEKFLIKRQEYFVWVLEDILYQAFLRAVEIGTQTPPVFVEYKDLFTVDAPDVTLRDNDQLASGAGKMALAFATLQNTLLGKSPTLHRIATDLTLKFAGEPQEDDVLDKIIAEAKADPIEPVMYPGQQPNADQSSSKQPSSNQSQGE
jgi:hypothetical protein